MATIIAKNQTVADLSLTRLSAPDAKIPASGQATLTDYNFEYEIAEDFELIDYIANDQVLLNLDNVDLNKSESLALASPAIFAIATPTANAIPKADSNGLLDSWVSGAIESAAVEVEPTGFADPEADITITWSDAAKTLTIAPTGASFDVWLQGVKYTKTTEVIDISATITEGYWFFYYNSVGVLQASTIEWEFEGDAPVSFIYWDATNSKALIVAWEPHRLAMDWATHKYLHDTVGALFEHGLAVSGDITGDGDLDIHAQVEVSTGEIHDEDLEISVTQGIGGDRFEQDLALPAKIPIWYLSGSVPIWRIKTVNSFPLMEGINRIQFNEFVSPNWVLSEISTNRNFVAVWLFATNDQTQPIIGILGQREDTTFNNADLNNMLASLHLANLYLPEMKILARLIFQTSTAYDNAPSARLQEILDLRRVQDLPSGGFVSTNHNSLSGRSDSNSHPANTIAVDTTNFDDILSTVDDTVQKALDTLDDGGVRNLDDLDDVDISAPAAGETLIYAGPTDGWVNYPIIDLALDTLVLDRANMDVALERVSAKTMIVTDNAGGSGEIQAATFAAEDATPHFGFRSGGTPGVFLSRAGSINWMDGDSYKAGSINFQIATPSGAQIYQLLAGPANATALRTHYAVELLAGLAGGAVSTTNLVPAGSYLLGTALRVTVAVTGPTDFDVGDGAVVDRFGDAIAIALSTTVEAPGPDATADPCGWKIGVQDVTLTPNGGNFTGGSVRVVAWYRTIRAPLG